MAKMKKTSPVAFVAGAVVVLLLALALGMGIRKLRLERALSRPDARMQTHTVEPEAVVTAEAPPDLSEEDEQFLTWLEEEMESAAAQEEAVAETEYEYTPQETAESIERPTPPTGFQQDQAAQSFGGWQQVWADLNLTEEEQTRIREGFRLAIERWQNMSPEEREAETARLREMGEIWQNMSEEERREASERMRDRFEEWRRSGRVELPELSLD
jgi:hypothetical protein